MYIHPHTDTETLGQSEFKDQLTQENDMHRFYRAHGQDCSTVVAVSKVTLEPSGESTIFVSRTKNKDHKHAERIVIEQTEDWLKDKDLTGQTTVKLTTMATYSPCSDCMSAIKDLLKKMKDKHGHVRYKLRVGYLYHREKGESISDSGMKYLLSNWKQQLKDIGVDFTLEPISVCDELPDYKPRPVKCKKHKDIKETVACQQCYKSTLKSAGLIKLEREDCDFKIVDNIRKINEDNLRQPSILDYFSSSPLTRGAELP